MLNKEFVLQATLPGLLIAIYGLVALGFAMAERRDKNQNKIHTLALIWPMVVFIVIGVKLYVWSRNNK